MVNLKVSLLIRKELQFKESEDFVDVIVSSIKGLRFFKKTKKIIDLNQGFKLIYFLKKFNGDVISYPAKHFELEELVELYETEFEFHPVIMTIMSLLKS